MSHVVHENVEEYRTEYLNLVSCLVPHFASLRYIFMILPLFLVLVPEASSDMTEIRNDYENILVYMINHLVATADIGCKVTFSSLLNCKWSLSEAFTNFLISDTYVIFGNFGAETLINRNITSSCNVSKCYSSFENANITCLTLCLKIKTNCTKKFPDVKNSMTSVSESTTKILNKNGYTLQPLNHRCSYRQCRKNIRKFDCTHALCCLKDVVLALRQWWEKFLYRGYS